MKIFYMILCSLSTIGLGFYCAGPTTTISTTTTVKYNLTIELSGYSGPHAGQLVHIKLKDAIGTATFVAQDSTTALSDDPWTVVFSNALVPGNTYYLDYYADFNSSTSYDVPPTDHAWRIVYPNVSGHVVDATVHGVPFTDISPF